MAAPPRRSNNNLSIPATRFSVYLGPQSGDAPQITANDDDDTPSDRVTYLKNPVVRRTSGSAESDSIDLDFDFDDADRRLENLTTLVGYSRQIELRLHDRRGRPLGYGAAWGDLTVQKFSTGNTESAKYIARLEDYHFGKILESRIEFSPFEGEATEVYEEVVFNPKYNDTIVGNMSDHTQSDNGEIYHVWVDQLTVRKGVSASENDVTASFWTIRDAVVTLCWMLNGEEEFVKNPEFESLDSIFEEPPEFQNVRLKKGEHLPQYLDDLLQPLGYDWYVSYEIKDVENEEGEEPDDPPQTELERRIQIYKRGEGPEKEVYLQAIGDELDLEKTNVASAEIENNMADLANTIIAHGSLQEYEMTFELQRGWSDNEDDLELKTLDKQPEHKGDNQLSVYDQHPNAWRKWVLNESAAYTGIRDGLERFNIYIDENNRYLVNKGRQIRDCLTLDDSQERRRPLIEYSIDDGDEWLEVPEEWYPEILKDEISVLFNQRFPWQVPKRAENFKLRITCSILDDQVLGIKIDRDPNSPNKRDVPLFLDVSDQFHYRKVVDQGDNKSAYISYGTHHGTDETDDFEKLEDHIDKLRNTYSSATMRTQIELFGLHFDYQIGDLITKINGRNITLNRAAASGGDPKYLQVTGIEWNTPDQKTTLLVEAIEDR